MGNCQEGLVYASNRDERKKAKGFKHNCSLLELMCCSLLWYSFLLFLAAVLHIILSIK